MAPLAPVPSVCHSSKVTAREAQRMAPLVPSFSCPPFERPHLPSLALSVTRLYLSHAWHDLGLLACCLLIADKPGRYTLDAKNGYKTKTRSSNSVTLTLTPPPSPLAGRPPDLRPDPPPTPSRTPPDPRLDPPDPLLPTRQKTPPPHAHPPPPEF